MRVDESDARRQFCKLGGRNWRRGPFCHTEDPMAQYFKTEKVETNGTPVLMVMALHESALNEDEIAGYRAELARISRTDRIVLDLAKLKHVGSPFVGMLIQLHKDVQRCGGSLCLCRPSEAMRFVMELLRLDQLFLHADCREDAISAVTAG